MKPAFKRVLIVEDEAPFRRVIARNLEARGCEVQEARTVKSALHLLDSDHPDLMLLDINLPDRTGWDILRVLRARGTSVPTVVVSAARVSPELLAEFRPLAYLPKPFPLEALLRLLGGEQQNDERAARGRAEAHLRASCRTLAATSTDVVDAMTLSIRAEEFGVSSGDWRDIALAMAKDYALHVDVSMHNDHMTVRFTREANQEDDGS